MKFLSGIVVICSALAVGLGLWRSPAHAHKGVMRDILAEQNHLIESMRENQTQRRRIKERIQTLLPLYYRMLSTAFAAPVRKHNAWVKNQLTQDALNSARLQAQERALIEQQTLLKTQLESQVTNNAPVGFQRGERPAPERIDEARVKLRLSLPLSAPRGYAALSTGDIAFSCSKDRVVRAVAEGKVIGVIEHEDGSTVTIRHAGGYISAYGGLESTDVVEGDELSESARLGTAGTQAHGCLLFSFRLRSQYLNALEALGLSGS